MFSQRPFNRGRLKCPAQLNAGPGPVCRAGPVPVSRAAGRLIHQTSIRTAGVSLLLLVSVAPSGGAVACRQGAKFEFPCFMRLDHKTVEQALSWSCAGDRPLDQRGMDEQVAYAIVALDRVNPQPSA